jgi:hypothetical protein
VVVLVSSIDPLLSPQIFGKCPKWVGNRSDSGMCDKANQFGACYAWKDFFRPFSGMDTQCLDKENYESYECPKVAPHKCKFHSFENLVVKTIVESQQIFGKCPGWVGNRSDSGMCDKVNQFGACYAWKDLFRPFSGMDTQCLDKEGYESYECPKVAPHKCKFHSFENLVVNTMVESQQIFGKCPGWVGNRADSGMCDKVNQFGACYAEKDLFRPLSGMDTQCLTKDAYKAYECPKVAPHKCKFHIFAETDLNILV